MIDLPTGVAGIVFDCDGTLIDSMPLHRQLWDDCLRPYGVSLPPDYIDTHAGKPTDVIVDRINHEFGVRIDATEFQEVKEGRFRERIDEAPPIGPVVELARAHRGRLPMAVVSGGCRANVVASLEAIDAADWFAVVLTADDPIAPKPAPDLFVEAARQIGVDPRSCHALEDADAGVTAARAAGMSVTDVRLLASP